MSDIKDMLGITSQDAKKSSPSATTIPTEPKFEKAKKKATSLKRKIKGATKLKRLLGDNWENAITLAPEAPSYRKKRRTNVHWVNQPITSSARPDEKTAPQLRHWVKITNMPDYRFARFNKPIRMMKYTDEEYDKYLQHPAWTRSQTDLLFSLCEQYDLRFVVIHDRFTRVRPGHPKPLEHPSHPQSVDAQQALVDELIVPAVEKTAEDLKARFYAIQKQLLTVRNGSDPDLKAHPVFQNDYDPVFEAERKVEMKKLYNRTRSAVSDMAELVLENRQLNAKIKKLKKAEKAAKASSDSSSSSSSSSSRKYKSSSNKKFKAGELASIPASCLAQPMNLFPPAQVGCFLRSSRLTQPLTITAKEAKLMESELSSLGFKKGKLTVPTRVICERYDDLRVSVKTLMNLSRYVRELEAQVNGTSLQTKSSSGRNITNKYL